MDGHGTAKRNKGEATAEAVNNARAIGEVSAISDAVIDELRQAFDLA